MNMVDFLAQAVVDTDLKMVGNTQLFRDYFNGAVHQGESFGVGFVEITALFFRDNQKMDRGLGAMVGDDDNFAGLVKDIGREPAFDDFGEH